LQQHFHGTEPKRFPWSKRDFLHLYSVDGGAIGGTEVLDYYRTVPHFDFGVKTGNRRIVDREIVGGIAAKAICSSLKFHFPSFWRTGINDEAHSKWVLS